MKRKKEKEAEKELKKSAIVEFERAESLLIELFNSRIISEGMLILCRKGMVIESSSLNSNALIDVSSIEDDCDNYYIAVEVCVDPWKYRNSTAFCVGYSGWAFLPGISELVEKLIVKNFDSSLNSALVESKRKFENAKGRDMVLKRKSFFEALRNL